MSKRNILSSEAIRFVVSGVVCFVVEFFVLVFLKELAHLDTLIATPIAFLCSVTVNYLMCVKWVFEGVDSNKLATQVGFLITSVFGLLLNELLMFCFRYVFGEELILFSFAGFSLSMYMVNKVLATLIVMVWNFFTKRYVLRSFQYVSK